MLPALSSCVPGAGCQAGDDEVWKSLAQYVPRNWLVSCSSGWTSPVPIPAHAVPVACLPVSQGLDEGTRAAVPCRTRRCTARRQAPRPGT
jgi:hypothetical protein